jgi:hypothetical protein
MYSEVYDVVLRWWRLPTGCLLPLGDGRVYRLLFAGRPGGNAGPDIRDAVLQDVSSGGAFARRGDWKDWKTGDVEFHIRTSDWVRHQHHLDPRYNQVILHVVLIYDDPLPTRLQNGGSVPVCSLQDLGVDASGTTGLALEEPMWPCQHVMAALDAEGRWRLFKHAGLLRFEQKAHAFVEQLRAIEPCGSAHGYDACLIPALAEGLGYGRDRVLFRALGDCLVKREQVATVGLELKRLEYTRRLPEPLMRCPAPLDTVRLGALVRLVEAWSMAGLWFAMRDIVLAVEKDGTLTSKTPTGEVSTHCDTPTCRDLPCGGLSRGGLVELRALADLRALFCTHGLSLARTDILLVNVVFPFALAVALLEGNTDLAERAYALYSAHPGLPSNCVTRTMCSQLGLSASPSGSCQQQGLHYIYQQSCRMKHCAGCIVGRRSQLLL